jgi:hypothetical protein
VSPEDKAGPVGLDPTMRMSLLSVALSAASLSIGALALAGPETGLGVAFGGSLATANLYVFARLGQAFLGQRGKTGAWAAIAVVKLVFLFGVIWIVLKSGWVSGIALAIGYGALPLGITLGGLLVRPPPLPDPPSDGSDGGSDGSLSARTNDVVEAKPRPAEPDPAGADRDRHA